MAEVSRPVATAPEAEQAPKLKYLDFFYSAVILLWSYVLKFYASAKDCSGILKPGLEKVEATVTAVVGPVIAKSEKHAKHLLVVVDGKVGEVLTFVDTRIPVSVKERSTKAIDFAKSVPQGTTTLFQEVKEKGAIPTAKVYIEKYEPAVTDAVKTSWDYVLHLPMAPRVVMFFLPLLVHLLMIYNIAASYLKQLGLPATSLLVTVDVQTVEKQVTSDVDKVLKTA